MNYFRGIKTVEELKEKMRELQFQHHPDRNGNSAKSTKISQEINSQFFTAKERIENPVKKPRKRTEKPVTAQTVQEPTSTVEKKRFFTENETETIATTAGKFGSAILKSVVRGFARKYNAN